MPSKPRTDITAWVLQYIFGGVVGGIGGFFATYRFDPVNASAAGAFALAGALLVGGLASLIGDALWYTIAEWFGGNADHYLLRPIPPEQTFWTRCLSVVSIIAAVVVVLRLTGAQ